MVLVKVKQTEFRLKPENPMSGIDSLYLHKLLLKKYPNKNLLVKSLYLKFLQDGAQI